MLVQTNIAGSDCVVTKYATDRWAHMGSPYIDARRDARVPHVRDIELVQCGQVVWRKRVGLCDAPQTIIALMRNGFQPLEGGA